MVHRLWMGTALVGLLAGGASATQPAVLAEAHARGTSVDWTILTPYERAVLTVATPDGEVVRSEIGPGSGPTFNAFDETGDARPDGSYNWELRLEPILAPDVERELAAALARSDEKAVRKIRRAHGLDRELVQSGTFELSGGAFVAGEETIRDTQASPEKLGSVTAAAHAYDTHRCVGPGCTSATSFNWAPFVVSGLFPNLHFEDTSGPSSGHDWAFIVNAQPLAPSGNFFSLVDLYTATIPLTIAGSAPTHSLFVNSIGRVGLGTSTPAAPLHIKSTVPSLRLESTYPDTAGQTWSVFSLGDFSILDLTAEKEPFHITRGAPSGSIWVADNGHVGMGSLPEAKLHVASFGPGPTDGKLLVKNTSLTTSGRELIEGNNNGTALIVLDDAEAAGNRWAFGSAAGGTFLWDNQADVAVEMALDTAGNLTTTGTVNGVSSREAKTGFSALDPKTTLSRVASLPISIWSYKADGPGVRHAGPMSEDFYQAFQLGQDDKHISFTDSAGIALAAVQGLNQIVQEKDQKIADLESRLEALERIVLEGRHQPRR